MAPKACPASEQCALANEQHTNAKGGQGGFGPWGSKCRMLGSAGRRRAPDCSSRAPWGREIAPLCWDIASKIWKNCSKLSRAVESFSTGCWVFGSAMLREIPTWYSCSALSGKSPHRILYPRQERLPTWYSDNSHERPPSPNQMDPARPQEISA